MHEYVTILCVETLKSQKEHNIRESNTKQKYK